jgi:voltage-gated potassium channel
LAPCSVQFYREFNALASTRRSGCGNVLDTTDSRNGNTLGRLEGWEMAHETAVASNGATTLRFRLYQQLDPEARISGLSALNKLIVAAIVFSVATAVLGTEPMLTRGYETYWTMIDGAILSLFVVEYLARIWICVENPRWGPGFRGRLRYASAWPALIDLAVLVPMLVFAAGSEAYLLRLARLMRILQLARLGRLSNSIAVIVTALQRRGMELLLSLGVAIVVVIFSSTCLYLLEADLQPEAFGSIPRAMWWSVITLTTVGYGDIYPHTPLGKAFAAMTAVSGVALVAMPAGILAAAFSDVLAERRRKDSDH